MTFQLRFPASDIHHWASRYPDEDDSAVEKIGSQMRTRGYLWKDDFVTLCKWKTPRPLRHYTSNSEELIQEVTRVALSTPCEELRIKVPQILSGVSWPVASVILHFGYDDLYPILDFRALWSAGENSPPTLIPTLFSFDYWWDYTRFCRDTAAAHCVTMRELDRALWQHSKERQSLDQPQP